MHEFIKCELAKCLDTLAQTSPASEEYSRILGGLHNVYTLSECIEECIAAVGVPPTAGEEESKAKIVEFPKDSTPFEEPEVFTPEVVEDTIPTTKELNEIAEINKAEPMETKEITFEELREALLKARMERGVNAAALVKQYGGVTNLTALAKDKYAVVMAALEKA